MTEWKIDRYKYSDKIIGIRYAYWFNLAKLFFWTLERKKLKLKNYKFQINVSLCKEKKGKIKIISFEIVIFLWCVSDKINSVCFWRLYEKKDHMIWGDTMCKILY